LVAVVLLVVGTKFGIFSFLVKGFRYQGITALLSGAGIISVGEFSFVLAELARNQGIISAQSYSTVLSLATLSLILSPLIYGLTSSLLSKYSKARETSPNEEDTVCSLVAQTPRHVVLAGCGRVGSKIMELFSLLKIPFLVIEIDPFAIDKLREKRTPAIFGDVSNREVLIRAGIGCASLFVLAVPDPLATRQAISWARKYNPEIKIVVRTHSDSEVAFLKEMGITSIVQPEIEASIEMVRHSLDILGFSKEETIQFLDSQRTPISQYPKKISED